MSAMMTGGSPGGQDFDLNLAPIIDCLTVLIAFMIASAAFLSIGILDAGVAGGASARASAGTPPPIAISLELGGEKSLHLKVTGKATANVILRAVPAGWDFDGLERGLRDLKARWPQVDGLTLSAEDGIRYEDVIRVMEATRKTLPVVILGGF